MERGNEVDELHALVPALADEVGLTERAAFLVVGALPAAPPRALHIGDDVSFQDSPAFPEPTQSLDRLGPADPGV